MISNGTGYTVNETGVAVTSASGLGTGLTVDTVVAIPTTNALVPGTGYSVGPFTVTEAGGLIGTIDTIILSGIITGSWELGNNRRRSRLHSRRCINNSTQADNCQGLPESNFTEKQWDNLGIYYPKDLEVENVIEMTKDCEAEAFKADKRISNSEGSTFSFSKNSHMILNTNGAYGAYNI